MDAPDLKHLFDAPVAEDGWSRRLREILTIDTIGVIFFAPDGKLLAANDTFLRWTGYAREDVASGRLDWSPTGWIGSREKEFLTKSGERRWMKFAGVKLDDGTIVEYVIDISRRKAAERGQRESEGRYRGLFESLDVGFCVIEMIYDADKQPVDYRFLEINPAFERQTGLHNARGRRMLELRPEHEEHWFRIYGAVAHSGMPRRFVEHASQLGEGIWYDVYAYPIDENGARHVGVLFNDITVRIKAEEELRQSARRKDEFLATLAHELRNPLAPIRNAVAMLRLAGPPDPTLQHARDVIDRQTRHLARLVDDLLDVSRITFGKVVLQRECLDLREVAREAASASEPLFDAASHRLNLRLDSRPVWVEGDRVRLAQVMSNLLSNAARYTPPGGEIAMHVEQTADAARIEVRDSGIGIEPQLLERIFEPFMQVEPAGPSSPGGLGIGLALAKSLIELHGGRVAAHSEGAGQGSIFAATLPLAEAPASEPAGETAQPATGGCRFLVVDDNVDLTTTQAELLRMMGHEVETAYAGPEALQKARAFRPQIVLLDLGMPGMDGIEVARRLRAMPEGRDALIVAQTGWGEESQRRRTSEAGFDEHLAKPVDPEMLLRLAERAR